MFPFDYQSIQAGMGWEIDSFYDFRANDRPNERRRKTLPVDLVHLVHLPLGKNWYSLLSLANVDDVVVRHLETRGQALFPTSFLLSLHLLMYRVLLMRLKSF